MVIGFIIRMNDKNGRVKVMKICKTDINVGDHVEVKYTTGKRFKGAILKGTVTKLWGLDDDNLPHIGFKQGQIDNGWCFHDHDVILKHHKVAK
jgi:hypothetical protein